MPFRLTTFAVALSVLTISLTGCAIPTPFPSDQKAGSATTASVESFSSADIMFAQMMIPHHQQAVDMSALALTRSNNPEILALADAISAAQGPEIEHMTSWLAEAGASMDMGHSMHMDGLLSDDDMAALERASGKEFDRLYLDGMIAHHQGAVAMAQTITDSANPNVAQLGSSIVASQTKEIELMKRILTGL
ncbi:MAG: DUF305 domain-containing protein [Microbacteriaceae bacterium]|nr:DUF305 domain-containing protein [Microbacteriaceae bacterium]